MAKAAALDRMALALLAALALTACKEDIVYQVAQKEALEIVVVLGEQGIVATTLPDTGEGEEPVFKIQVDSADSLRAKEILLRQQLPRVKPRGLSEVFSQPSMIPTATEEKARLMLALQGDMSGTLETVEDVVDAQVHIVLPEANPLESESDRTEARAAVLVKYRKSAPTGDDEERTRDRWRQKERLLLGLRDDLLRLQEVWTKHLVRLEREDADLLKQADLSLAKSDDKELNAAKEAVRKLDQSLKQRQAHVSLLQNLPNLKDLDATLREIDTDEGLVLPIRAASVRSLIANSIPRLKENNVTVEFTPIPDRRQAPSNTVAVGGASKQLVLILGGVAAVMTLAVIGLGLWVSTLQKKVKAKAAT